MSTLFQDFLAISYYKKGQLRKYRTLSGYCFRLVGILLPHPFPFRVNSSPTRTIGLERGAILVGEENYKK
jgi:hypothetical protein